MNSRVSYHEYQRFDADVRYEVIDGVPFAMAAPSRSHQQMSGQLLSQLVQQLNGQPCEAYAAPFDVLIDSDSTQPDTIENSENIVQPDLFVLCDETKSFEKYCVGAPDFIIEILSPSTSLRDMNTKRKLYETYGVKEYWIVHPVDHWVMINILDGSGTFEQHEVQGLTGSTTIAAIKDLTISWDFLPNFV